MGYANVGKHCVIQSLIPNRSCPSAILNDLKHVKIDKQYWLLDSPARLFSAPKEDDNLVLRNCLKAENPSQSLPLVQQIVTKCPQELLCQAFKISAFKPNDSEEFLNLVGVKRGKLKRGGIPDINVAAKTVIQYWNTGKIPFYSNPPKNVNKNEEIKKLNEEFNVNKIYLKMDNEAKNFTSKTQSNFYLLEPNNAASMGIDEIEEKMQQKNRKGRKREQGEDIEANEEEKESEEEEDDEESEMEGEVNEKKKNKNVEEDDDHDEDEDNDSGDEKEQETLMEDDLVKVNEVRKKKKKNKSQKDTYDFLTDFV